MNGLPDVAVCVELVERVVKVAVDVRDPAGLPVQVVDVLEQVLLVLCELLGVEPKIAVRSCDF